MLFHSNLPYREIALQYTPVFALFYQNRDEPLPRGDKNYQALQAVQRIYFAMLILPTLLQT